jgi:hypothetical protein
MSRQLKSGFQLFHELEAGFNKKGDGPQGRRLLYF